MTNAIVLNENHPFVKHLCDKDKRLSKIIKRVGDITYVPYDDGFAFLIHEVIEQMLSIKAGAKIYERLEKLCNGHVTPETLVRLSIDEIRGTGTSTSKANYILGIADAVISKELNLEDLSTMSDADVYNTLTRIKGIGSWTAKMYLLFVLNRQDVLPYEDVAFLQTYKWLYKTDDVSRESVIKKCKKWKPYSSIAARYMYRALDLGFTKET